jgi:hypothetical protein
MLRRIRRLPSPALVISVIALIAAVGGGTFAFAISDKKSDKRIAKKVANKQITKRAPNLSVNHASTADNATNASQATNASTVNGADASNLVSGYATIAAGASPTVRNFGGKRVTSVTVSRVSTGDYDVTFNGNFPGVTSINQVATFATMWDTDDFDTASASNDQSAASSSAITVRVFTWKTSTAALTDRDFSVSIQTP